MILIDFRVTGSNLTPGLWSAAECELLVVSGNLPLLRPLFRRAGNVLKWRFGQSQILNDEESSGILELSGKGHYSIKRPPHVDPDYSVVSRATVARDGGAKAGFRGDLPSNRILVEMDFERDTQNVGASTPASSIEPSVIRESM